MNARILTLSLLAIGALPALGQTPPAPYAVQVTGVASSGSGSLTYGQVWDFDGMNIQRLLARGALGTSQVSNRLEISFMTDWRGGPALEALVGQVAGASASLSAWENATSGYPRLVLGRPKFNRWTLHAENGSSATQTSGFTCSSKQVVTSSPAM